MQCPRDLVDVRPDARNLNPELDDGGPELRGLRGRGRALLDLDLGRVLVESGEGIEHELTREDGRPDVSMTLGVRGAQHGNSW